ncbi:hypothetical protein CROQUDRAFT_49860, partial [Cronartium quercuum f. sp. fusiforme G11]
QVYLGWPLYAILLVIKQVLGATSFHMLLLGGTSSQQTFDLYSKFQWCHQHHWVSLLVCVEQHQTSYILTFNALGMLWDSIHTHWSAIIIQYTKELHHSPSSLTHCFKVLFLHLCCWIPFFFSTNFGEEARGASDTWVFQACVVQGMQQVWVSSWTSAEAFLFPH